MNVTVIVPWRPGCPHRERAWAWVRDRYNHRHPDWQLVADPAPAGPWIKAHALPATITADIVLVADADVWCDNLNTAIQAIADGAAWAVPHNLVHRLSQPATARLLAGSDTSFEYAQPPYQGTIGGGIVALPAAMLRGIPLDPRFIGWGQEDESWGVALTCLHGPAWRGTSDLLHLWHPPQERLSRTRGNPEGWRLRRRYLKARNDPAAMRALLEEARALAAHQPALHHPATADEHHGEDPVRAAA